MRASRLIRWSGLLTLAVAFLTVFGGCGGGARTEGQATQTEEVKAQQDAMARFYQEKSASKRP